MFKVGDKVVAKADKEYYLNNAVGTVINTNGISSTSVLVHFENYGNIYCEVEYLTLLLKHSVKNELKGLLDD